MKKKLNCKRCGKVIVGTTKIINRRQKLGNKSINRVDTYCEPCYKIVNKERAIKNERSKQKRPCKRKG